MSNKMTQKIKVINQQLLKTVLADINTQSTLMINIIDHNGIGNKKEIFDQRVKKVESALKLIKSELGLI